MFGQPENVFRVEQQGELHSVPGPAIMPVWASADEISVVSRVHTASCLAPLSMRKKTKARLVVKDEGQRAK